MSTGIAAADSSRSPWKPPQIVQASEILKQALALQLVQCRGWGRRETILVTGVEVCALWRAELCQGVSTLDPHQANRDWIQVTNQQGTRAMLTGNQGPLKQARAGLGAENHEFSSSWLIQIRNQVQPSRFSCLPL